MPCITTAHSLAAFQSSVRPSLPALCRQLLINHNSVIYNQLNNHSLIHVGGVAGRPSGRTLGVLALSSTNGHSSNGNGNGVPYTTKTRPAAEVSMTATEGPLNVLGTPLQCCCTSPVTGFYRDGFCRTDASDQGRHVVCARVTKAFLDYSKTKGNDLMTPAPWYNFPGLKDGDKWCLCAARWREAIDAGCAPPVYLRCTHVKALEYVSLQQLKEHALDLET